MLVLFTLVAKKADRNNIFRKRKLSRKEVPIHILHAGGCRRECVCHGMKYCRNFLCEQEKRIMLWGIGRTNRHFWFVSFEDIPGCT